LNNFTLPCTAFEFCLTCLHDLTRVAEANDSQTDSKCNLGYTGNDGENCDACVAGKYKIATGDGVCTNCTAGQYSTAVAAATDVCLTCPLNSVSAIASDELADCMCNESYSRLNADLCVFCVPGKYKATTGNATCINCMAGQYSTAVAAMSDVCEACVTNANSIEASGKQTDCTCNSGYTRSNGGPCVACIAGKYKVATGDMSCTNCVAGQYSGELGAICEACHRHRRHQPRLVTGPPGGPAGPRWDGGPARGLIELEVSSLWGSGLCHH